MAQTQYKFTPEQFLNQVGKAIESYASLDEGEIQPFINEVCDQVYMLIDQYGSLSGYEEDDALSEWQLEQLIKAEIYQAQYLLMNNINVMDIFGIDRFNNQQISNAELKERYWSPKAKMILNNAGFLYRGL